jgi:hypothetical protein
VLTHRQKENTMAKLTKPLFGAANGEVYPRIYDAGEDCPDELQEAAIEAGALETEEEMNARIKAAEHAAKDQKVPAENKAAAPAETK